MQDDDHSLNDFQPALAPASVSMAAEQIRSARRHRQREQFIRVPMAWAGRLSGARYTATLKVALHLLDRAFRTRRSTVLLANAGLVGVTRWQKWRAIEELETMGLIKVEHRPRRSPEITLLYPEVDR
jgi:hypothetical protein